MMKTNEELRDIAASLIDDRDYWWKKAVKLGRYAAAAKRVAMKHRGPQMTPWLFRNSVRCELGVSMDKNEYMLAAVDGTRGEGR